MAFGGCNDFLDIPKKGLVIPGTIEDFREMMNNYDLLSKGPANMFYTTDNIQMYSDDRGFTIFPQGVTGYCFSDYMYESETQNDEDWNQLYKQIHVCNTVIEGIDKAEGSDELRRRQVKGEALAHRAYAYFMLVNEYGPHYDAATAASDLGVPLYVEGDGIGNAKARESVARIYEFVEQDLLAAVDLVAETTNEKFKPTRTGVQGMLALMYLYKGNWPEAARLANLALTDYHELYQYAGVEFMMPEPMKWMGYLGYVPPGGGLRKNAEVVWMKFALDNMLYVTSTYWSDDLLALYDADDRRPYLQQIQAGMFGAGVHGELVFSMNFPFFSCGIHVPHLLLIRAEANARNNKKDDAVGDLNTLRSNRMNTGGYTAYVASEYTADQVLAMVLDERRRELIAECWRWFDLKRLNKDPRFATTITRTYGEGTYVLKPTSPNYVMAIPKNVCSFNGKIVQNPRGL